MDSNWSSGERRWTEGPGRLTRPLDVIFIAFNQLSEISFRVDGTLVLAVLVALLNNVQNPLDGATTHRVLANFELAG